MSSTRTYDRTITVLGSPSVGKTALMTRFLENRFMDDYKPTIAKSKHFRCVNTFLYIKIKFIFLANYRDVQYNGSNYKLTILDTAGLESFTSVPSGYITNTSGYIIVYSINNRERFDIVKEIYQGLVEANSRS